MRLLLRGSQSLNLRNIEDLYRLVPKHLTGKVLNYGQGEGQFQVEETVWGVYISDEGEYYLQFEEGNVPWSVFVKTGHALIENLIEVFDIGSVEVHGALEGGHRDDT